MVELVDTQDLKSCDHCGRAGSSPARGTQKASQLGDCEAFLFLSITSVFKRVSKFQSIDKFMNDSNLFELI